MEGARQGQRFRKGPVTGPLDRPSQQPLETRKAADHIRPARDAIHAARRTVASIHAAELQLLAASQRAERSQAIRAIDAALAARHTSNIAAVIARFADRRTALAQMIDPNARAAAAHQLAAEETAELARLALEHAAEKRQIRKSTLGSMSTRHRATRRNIGQRLRRQRLGIAVQLQTLRPRPMISKSALRVSARMRWRFPAAH